MFQDLKPISYEEVLEKPLLNAVDKLSYKSETPFKINVFVHGTGESGFDYQKRITALAKDILNTKSLLVYPGFSFPYHFLEPKLDELLIKELNQLKAKYNCDNKINLFGFSGGAMFSHRFALKHPSWVSSCCCFSAGSWTNPEGSHFGYIVDEAWMETYPAWSDNKYFNAATSPAREGWQDISWLIGCGKQDLKRYPTAQQFAKDLNTLGSPAVEFYEFDQKHKIGEAEINKALTFFKAKI